MEKAKGDTKLQDKLTQKYADNSMSSYTGIIDSMSSFYDEDDDRRKKQMKLAKYMHITQMAMQLASLTQTIAVEGAKSGLLATNAHVIEDAKKIEVEISNELGVFKYNAKIELKDSNNDVAILKIDDPNFKKLSIIPYELIQKSEIGENVFTIGFPLNDIMGTNYKVTNGIISSNTGIENDVRFYQISVPLQPGNSGGPLFNKDGNIVGLTTAKLDPEAVGTNVENVNYAVKAQYLIDILNLMPSYKSPKPEFRAKGKELADQVKILKNFVCLIEVTQ